MSEFLERERGRMNLEKDFPKEMNFDRSVLININVSKNYNKVLLSLVKEHNEKLKEKTKTLKEEICLPNDGITYWALPNGYELAWNSDLWKIVSYIYTHYGGINCFPMTEIIKKESFSSL